ncbi:T9SS sorting signal type C domain-containing protein [Flavobacterium sp. P21]|uniref:T9SS sorting signal type C domain-containing protein n=1 Tax=Flavobacterium sp. P21 TaxID=3423948 RepID=UPI003D6695EB
MPQRNTTFFKPSKSHESAKSAIEKRRIWLDLKNEEGVFKQILVGYMTGATNSYDDDYDAESFNGNQFVDFYSITEDKKMVIQARGLPFEQTDSILLGYSSVIEGEFSISIDRSDNQFVDSDIYIEDRKLKIIHNLKKAPYFFKTEKGTFDDRFELKYVDKELDVDNFQDVQNGILIYSRNRQIHIEAKNEIIKEASVFDLSGKNIYKKAKVKSSNLSIENLNVTNQILFVKIILENGDSIAKTVIF